MLRKKITIAHLAFQKQQHKAKSKKHLLNLLENIIQIKIPHLKQKKSFQKLLKLIQHFLMIKNDRSIIKRVWQVTSKNNMKMQALIQMLKVLIFLIFSKVMDNKVVVVLKMYLEIFRTFLVEDKLLNLIDHKEVQILYYHWNLNLWKQ